MLRQCRLCARQLEIAVASPVASTSKSPVRGLPVKRSKQHARRLFSQSSRSSQGHDAPTATIWIEEFPPKRHEEPGPGTALWKGKARAIDLPPLTRAPYDAEKSQRPQNEEFGDDSDPANTEASPSYEESNVASTSTTSSSATSSSESQTEAASALLAILHRITDPEDGAEPPPIDTIIREVLELIHEHASDLPDHVQDLVRDVNWSADSSYALLPALATIYLESVQGNRFKRLRQRYRDWLGNATTRLEGQLDVRDDVLVRSVEAFARRGNDRVVVGMAQHLHSLTGTWIPEVLRMHLEALLALDEPDSAPKLEDLPSDLPATVSNLLITTYLRAGDLSAARHVFGLLQAGGIKPDHRTFQAILKGYRAFGASHSLYRALAGTMLDLHLPHTTETINVFIECCLATGDLEGAHELFRHFERPESSSDRRSQALLPPSDQSDTKQASLPDPSPAMTGPATVASPPDAYSTSETTSILPAVQALPMRLEADQKTLELFVRGYLASGDLDKALDAMTRIIEQGRTPDAVLTKALRKAYQQQDRPLGQDQKADYLDHILDQSLDLRADLDTASEEMRRKSAIYHDTIKSTLDSNGLAGVPAIVDQMTEEGLIVNRRALTWIVAHVAQNASPSKIRSTMAGLRQGSSSSPTLSEFNVMLDALIGEDKAQTVLRGLQPNVQARIAPGVTPILGKKSEAASDQFSAVLDWFREAALLPDAYTCAVLMRRFAESKGSPKALWDFFQRQVLHRGLQPSPHHITPLMAAYCNANDPYGARRAMDRGEALGVQPNVFHYTVLLGYYARSERPELVQGIFRDMRKRGIRPDTKAYTILAHAAASRGLVQKVFSVIKQYIKMLPDAPWPEPGIVTSLFMCRNRRGEYKLAQEVMSSAMDEGLIPDAILYRVLWRNMQDHQVNRKRLLRRRQPDLAAIREEAYQLARANLKRVLKLSQARRVTMRESEPRKSLERALSETLEAIRRNRSTFESETVIDEVLSQDDQVV